MRDDERRQAAAQRCADLANSYYGEGLGAEYFLDHTPLATAQLSLNLTLQLDELAGLVMVWRDRMPQSVLDLALQHILPEPKPSPVERLGDELDVKTDALEYHLKELGLKLVEVDPSDDQ